MNIEAIDARPPEQARDRYLPIHQSLSPSQTSSTIQLAVLATQLYMTVALSQSKTHPELTRDGRTRCRASGALV